ncbi:MAG: hypothetical protein Q7I97_07660 [Thermovirgaceae bacterium]|nr:hypothetical protein [Thermovirgaceae bacterium]
MAKKIWIVAAVLASMVLASQVAFAQDISGEWDVEVHGYNYFTDRSPSRLVIPETNTTMKITQTGSNITVTFGGFAGAMSATNFTGKVGENHFSAVWWFEGYPNEARVLTGHISPDGVSLWGELIYPRVSNREGVVPGWVEVSFVAKRKVLTLVPGTLVPVTPIIPGAVQLLLKEDCIAFNPVTTEVKNITGRWKIVDGSHWILDFEGNKAEADKALKIIKHYGLNSQCFVGRPDPSLTYWRVSGQAPSGPAPGEDAIGFNPDTIEVKQINGRWKIVDGSHWILDFEGHENEARTAFNIIKKYGFRYICFVGRPDPSMTYFRK